MQPYWQSRTKPPGAGKRKASSFWWDVLALSAGLFLAWCNAWKVLDLVWCLWLSSLVVGYSVIIVDIFVSLHEQVIRPKTGMLALAFFTLHFCLAHILYAFFLNGYFPLTQAGESFGWATCKEVFFAYWMFIPAVAVSERGLFDRTAIQMPKSVISGIADAGSGVFAPYQNVLRLHVLILVLAALHFIRLESFPVYALVYVVNFVPWKRVHESLSEQPT